MELKSQITSPLDTEVGRANSTTKVVGPSFINYGAFSL